ATLALLVTLLVGFTEIYVGAHYPIDELAGLGLGAVVALVGWPLLRAGAAAGNGPHRQHAHAHAHAGGHTLSLAGELSGLGRPAVGSSGPAAQPVPLAATGSVRLLEAPRTGELGTLPPPLRRRPAAVPASPAPLAAAGLASAGGSAAGGSTAGAPPASRARARDGDAGAATTTSTAGVGASDGTGREPIAVFPRPPAREPSSE
ncbi:MAG TPA: hypothetical protein VMD59_10945, partial [Acidimicrobiales bacterium]|nr:hypothetical protein [Acidimicrobiales bacterium]